jgi:hypothetical protein
MKTSNRIWFYILAFLLTVITIYLYASFVFEECRNGTGVFWILTHILGLFITGLMCLITFATIFILYYLVFWIVNDDLKILFQKMLLQENKEDFKPAISYFFIIGTCLIGYLIWGNSIFGCI